jgi:hypothetical protein
MHSPAIAGSRNDGFTRLDCSRPRQRRMGKDMEGSGRDII